jgi:carboxypeptidase Q
MIIQNPVVCKDPTHASLRRKGWLLLLAAVWTIQPLIAQKDSSMIANIYAHSLSESTCYEDLRYLCKQIGHRLAGSASADQAIQWGEEQLKQIGADKVWLMPVEVPQWQRGSKEEASYTYREGNMQYEVFPSIVALGGSVGSDQMLHAPIIEVKSLEELEVLGREKIEGKIVFFNKGLDPLLINTGAAYGGGYPIRGKGPSEAARYGAVACLIRSLTLSGDDFAHTGATQYNDSVPAIPAAALSAKAASELSQALTRDTALTFHLHLHCRAMPRKTQYNVIAEWLGTAGSEAEYLTIGGHLDSWDVGEGAHDDGAGIVQSIQVLRTLKALGYRPKNNIRIVLFINEEFGNDGGETYAAQCKAQGLRHLAAIESDGGGFTPRGFSCELSDVQYQQFMKWKPLLEPYGLHLYRRGGSGVDIRPLSDDRIGLFGLSVDTQRYFDYHHSGNDVFEQVNKRELELGAAAMAALVYLLDQHGWHD